jgi:hypothetical protein
MAADQELEVVNLFANPGEAMAGFSGDAEDSAHLVIPDTRYTFMGTGAYMKGGLSNETFREATLICRVYSAEGDLLDTVEETIAPGQSLVVNPGTAPFDRVSDGGWIEIVSKDGEKLSGYQYIKDISGGRDILDTLPALPVMSNVKYLPHIPPPAPVNKWRTELTLINPTEKTNRLEFHFSRAGGAGEDPRVFNLGPREKRVIDATGEFGQLPGEALYRSILTIEGEYPFVGYYCYTPVTSSKNTVDKVSYPLLSESSFKKELVLSHVPKGVDKWWTGVCLGNPNSFSVDVEIEPYNYDGELMADQGQTLTLDAGAYTVFTVYDRFGGLTPEISFLRFKGDGGQSEIGGFYLYGNKKDGQGSVKALSGENL